MSSPVARKPALTVSIVVHNSSIELLRGTLQSLERAVPAATGVDSGSVVVYLIDNASESDYLRELDRLLEDVPPERLAIEVLKRHRNDGFGAGHNSVIHRLESDYHLILNPDVELAPETLARGIERMRMEPDVALLSPRVVGADGRQQFLCKRYPSVFVLMLRVFLPRFLRPLFRRSLNHYQMRDICAGDREADVLLASGCFMLVRTEDLQLLGGFDERYFLYFEDFDLSLRYGSRGRLVFAPSLEIVHHGGYAARKGPEHVKYFIQSGLLFFRQHGWRWF